MVELSEASPGQSFGDRGPTQQKADPFEKRDERCFEVGGFTLGFSRDFMVL